MEKKQLAQICIYMLICVNVLMTMAVCTIFGYFLLNDTMEFSEVIPLTKEALHLN